MSKNAEERILVLLYEAWNNEEGAPAFLNLNQLTQWLNRHFKKEYPSACILLYTKNLIGSGLVTVGPKDAVSFRLTELGQNRGESAWKRRFRIGYTAMNEEAPFAHQRTIHPPLFTQLNSAEVGDWYL